eukprot:9793194-Karenia_brevis.AAC.1
MCINIRAPRAPRWARRVCIVPNSGDGNQMCWNLMYCNAHAHQSAKRAAPGAVRLHCTTVAMEIEC